MRRITTATITEIITGTRQDLIGVSATVCVPVVSSGSVSMPNVRPEPLNALRGSHASTYAQA